MTTLHPHTDSVVPGTGKGGGMAGKPEQRQIDTARNRWLVFVGAFTVAILFALYTNHAWEDWYITYRASKNLATGNGLVFTAGERVHSFTSPLGTLLPAMLNILTGNGSDDLVLWLFRLVNCCLLGTSAVFLLRIARMTMMGTFAAAIMVGLFVVDAKIIDFSINGMETALMMVFLALSVIGLLQSGRLFVVISGIAWAGLMWTRPDGFVYLGALLAGFMLFRPGNLRETPVRELLRDLARAGLLAAILYLPWFAWSWHYYGTPVPHTITAKGLLYKRHFVELAIDFFKFPYISFLSDSNDWRCSVYQAFLPPWYSFGGWVYVLPVIGKIIGLVSTFYWCLPFAPRFGRAVSFALYLSHFYLSCVTAYVAPWYVPSVTLLSIIVIGQVFQNLSELVASGRQKERPRVELLRHMISIGGIALVSASLLLTVVIAYQMRLQQTIVENGNRKKIGLWLKDNAAPNDTVFLECLGYIGFFSQLKMYDWPGMSSPEMVAARKRLNTEDFGKLIDYLRPSWLVLRPFEVQKINDSLPEMLKAAYMPVRIFDVSSEIAEHKFLPGRPYLWYDQTFVVYRRLVP